jgi:adenosylhomocysteine nucleosidase
MSKLIQEVLNNKPLGVLCAMPEEVEQYLNHFEEVHSEEVSGVKFYRGTLGAVDVVLGQCGVGM